MIIRQYFSEIAEQTCCDECGEVVMFPLPAGVYFTRAGQYVCYSCVSLLDYALWSRDLDEEIADWLDKADARRDAFVLLLCREAGWEGADAVVLARWERAHPACCRTPAWWAANGYYPADEIMVRRCMGLTPRALCIEQRPPEWYG